MNGCAVVRGIHSTRSDERKDEKAPDGKSKMLLVSKVCFSDDSVHKQQIKPGNRCLKESASKHPIRFCFISVKA